MELIYKDISQRSTTTYTFEVYVVELGFLAKATTKHKNIEYFSREWRVYKISDFLDCDFLGLRLAKIFLNSDFFKENICPSGNKYLYLLPED